VPSFLKELPRDPRANEELLNQYVYISNGENYKLLAGYPEKTVTRSSRAAQK
jgi:hypothetical protein